LDEEESGAKWSNGQAKSNKPIAAAKVEIRVCQAIGCYDSQTASQGAALGEDLTVNINALRSAVSNDRRLREKADNIPQKGARHR
jgi:hypothetical protein